MKWRTEKDYLKPKAVAKILSVETTVYVWSLLILKVEDFEALNENGRAVCFETLHFPF